jgi:hypothetical protein
MVRIRRFGVVRTSNIAALWTLVVGLIILVPFAIILAAAGEMTTTDQFGNQFTMSPGPIIVGFLVGIVIYAGFLWVFTAIGLLIYNLVAGFTGGLEMELEQPPAPTYVAGPAWGQPPTSTPPGGAYQPPAGYGQAPGGFAPAAGWGQPQTPPAAPTAAPPAPTAAPPAPQAAPPYEPPPAAERPTYDPAPRWDAPRPDDERRGEPDRS